MKKINEIGIKLLEYKDELTKDYPKIVRESLVFSLEQMLNNKIIDLTTYEIIKDIKENRDSFMSYLLTKDEFVKTYEELFEEYEVFRKELDEELKNHELFDLKTKTVVEKDVIYILKTFSIDEDFVMNYFGVEKNDLSKLMKGKGFVEKFVVLRLTKVLKDIIDMSNYNISVLCLDNSLVYFNEESNEYNIDLIMKIKIEDISVSDKKKKIIIEIKDVKTLAENIYKDKVKI